MPTSSLEIVVKLPRGETIGRLGLGRWTLAGLPGFAAARPGTGGDRAEEAVPARSRLCLLRADGEIVGADGQAADPQGAYLLVLARELCRFHLFPSVEGVSRSRTEDAAALYFETHAPYLASDCLKLWTPSGIAIWSWDSIRVAELLGGRAPYYRARMLPEPLVHPPGTGWCQRADVRGFEAQYWQEGSLVASMWRRRPFDQDQWNEFVSDVRNPAEEPPLTPPEPDYLPLPRSVRKLPARVNQRWGWKQFELAAASVALLAAAYGSYQFGQSMGYERLAEADLASLDRVVARADASAERRGALGQLAMAREFSRMGSDGTPLTAAAFAFSILGQYGFTILDWRVDDTAFQAEISPAPNLALMRDVASILEEHPLFENVSTRSQRGSDSLVIEAELEGRPSTLPRPDFGEEAP